MAALTNAELPPGFTTLEQLGIYVGIVANSVYPQNNYVVSNTNTERISDIAIINTLDGRDFFITRFAIPLDPNYTTPNNPLWTYATENEIIAIPQRFKV